MLGQYQPYVDRFSNQYGIPAGLLNQLINAESGGNNGAVSPVGAIGFGQLMPSTAHSLGIDPHDPIQNLRGTAMYLGNQLKTFHGDVSRALAAYNAGPGAVQKYNGIPPYAETQAYVKKIMGSWNGGTATNPQYGSGIGGQPQQTQAAWDEQPGMDVKAQRLGEVWAEQGGAMAGRLANLELTPPVIHHAAQFSDGSTAPVAGGQVDYGKLPTGLGTFGGQQVAAWMIPALQYGQQHGWTGQVTSGYRDPNQVVHNSIPGGPVAPQGHSNHNFTTFPGGAFDASQAQQLWNILKGSQYAGLIQWAGNKDPMHFSHPHNGGY